MCNFIINEIKLKKVSFKIGSKMENIVVINSGGTFNKVYNPLNGQLEIQQTALPKLQEAWLCQLNIVNSVQKDSLHMTDNDREKIVQTILNTEADKILLLHGTDTIDQTAQFLDNHIKKKTIVLTGAMVPYSIDTTEASTNFGFAMGFLRAQQHHGTYIAIHGIANHYRYVVKDREKGCFIDTTLS
jgi:L-asparaginase